MTCDPTGDLCSWEEALKIKGRSEYEVTVDENDSERLYSTCQKHPGHESFIPINHLSKELLPEGYGTDELVNLIRSLATLTTRILVNKVSSDRPQRWPSCKIPYPCHGVISSEPFSRAGTGFIEFAHKMFAPVQGKCPCPECLSSGNRSDDWWEIRVSTATHLVFDGIEAASTVIDCFYDNDDTSLFYRLYGVRVCEIPHRIESDRCILICVTHNVDFGGFVQQMVSEPQQIQTQWSRRTESFFQNHTLVVSHPHGIPAKAITIGRTHHVTVPVGPTYPVGQRVPFPPDMSYRLTASSTLSSTSEEAVDLGDYQPHANSMALLPTTGTHSANIPPHGQEFPLPSNMTFVLPPDADFARQWSLDKSHSFVFPHGTRYFLDDGRELSLPPEVEFLGWPLEDIILSISYSAETCPGSSGANVFTLEPRRLQQHRYYRCRSLASFIHCRSASRQDSSSGYSPFVTPQPNYDLMSSVHVRAKA